MASNGPGPVRRLPRSRSPHRRASRPPAPTQGKPSRRRSAGKTEPTAAKAELPAGQDPFSLAPIERPRCCPRFFIDRPIFANVIAYATILIGAVCLFVLPCIERRVPFDHTAERVQGVDQLPPGPTPASCPTLSPHRLSRRCNGVEGMLSPCLSTCRQRRVVLELLTVTFEGRDQPRHGPRCSVQNRVAIASPPKLPERSSAQGSPPRKKSTRYHLWWSPSPRLDNSYDSLFLSNYATLRVKDECSAGSEASRDIAIFGSNAARLRHGVWLDPEKLKARNPHEPRRQCSDANPRAGERITGRRRGQIRASLSVPSDQGLPVHRHSPWARLGRSRAVRI